MLKIAILAHLKHPIGQPFGGGLEMHTHLLARGLVARGHAVTLLASEDSDPALVADPICPPTGEAFDAADAAAIDRAEAIAYAAMLARIEAGDFDIVHNNSLHPLPLRRSGALGIPMVTVLHTPPFWPLAEGVRASAPGMAYAAVSDSLASEWRDIRAPIRVIGNGIDLAAFPFAAVPETPAHAFWSGRIVPEKGLHLAIDATRRAGMPLAFAGPRYDAAYWRAEIAPRLGPDLCDLGHLPHRALAEALGRAAVALVTPCWAEPFGLVVAEALACGTPVAAFSRGALPDILDAQCGSLAEADDVAGLARAIGQARHLDRRACRRRAEMLFDAEVMMDRYEDLYREAIAAARAPARPREVQRTLFDETEA